MKKLAAAAAAVLMLSLCSCNIIKPVELSRRLIIEAVGIDRENSGVRITLQTLDAFFGASDKDGGDISGSTKIYVFSGRTPSDALAQAEGATGLIPLFSQIKLIVISKEAAYGGVTGLFDYFLKETNLRPDTLIAVSQNSAEEIVSADVGSAAGSAAVLDESVKAGSEAGTALYMPLYRFLSLVYGKYDSAICPVIAVKKSGASGSMLPEVTGTALFDGERLSDIIGKTETAALLFLTGRIGQPDICLETGGGETYSVKILSSKTKYKISAENGRLRARITITARCDVTEADLSRTADAETLLKNAEDHIYAMVRGCFSDVCEDKDMDVCRLRKRAAILFPAYPNSSGEIFPNTEISVVLKTK